MTREHAKRIKNCFSRTTKKFSVVLPCSFGAQFSFYFLWLECDVFSAYSSTYVRITDVCRRCRVLMCAASVSINKSGASVYVCVRVFILFPEENQCNLFVGFY